MRKVASEAVSTPPSLFYKYMRAETAESILKTQSLRWSSPLLFSDVFDVTRVLDFGYTAEQLNEAIHEEFARLIEAGANDLPTANAGIRELLAQFRVAVAESKETSAEMAQLVRAMPVGPVQFEAGALRTVQGGWDKMIPKLRILCMTTAPDSPQMWAYYADELRGVVMEFVPSDSYPTPFRRMRRVRYSNEQPRHFTHQQFARVLIGLTHEGFREYFEELQYTKDALWAHEKEWRAIGFAGAEDTNMFNDFAFPPMELRRILYGPHISDAARRRIEELRTAPPWGHVMAANTQIDHQKRAFVFHPHLASD